jgi:PAS domain S-box-containing protein
VLRSTDPEDRQQIRLLTWVLAISGCTGLLFSILFPITQGHGWRLWNHELFLYDLLSTASTAVCFLILRRGYLRLAIWSLLSLAGANAVAFLAVWYSTWPHIQIFAVVPLVFASIFLSGRDLLSYFTVYNLAVLPVLLSADLPFAHDTFGFEGIIPVSLLLLVARHHHSRLERDRSTALAASEARLRAVTDAISDIIMQVDSDLIIRYLSPSFERLTGWPSARLLGRPLHDMPALCHPDDRERIRQTMDDRLSSGRRESFSYRFMRHDGGEIWLETVMSVEAGATALATFSSRDISDRKQADEMRAHDRLKDEFLSTVAHELRGPLAIIHGYAELLADGHVTAERRASFADRIRRQSQHLARIIDDLLDIERMKVQGVLALHREPVNLATLVADELAAFGEAFPSHRFALDNDLDLPPISLDRHRISQVLRNLLSNAVKYSPAGSLVQVVVRGHGERAEIIVCDEGAGISVAQQARLFEPFYRAGAPSGVRGTGLGLAISRTIATLHGGDVTVASEIGQGSRFSLWLPVDSPNDELKAA